MGILKLKTNKQIGSRVRLHVYVPSHIHKSISEIAADEDWNKTQVVVEALKKFIKEKSGETR